MRRHILIYLASSSEGFGSFLAFFNRIFQQFCWPFFREGSVFFENTNLATLIKRWLPANKAVVFNYFSDPGLRRIPCYTLFHRTEVLSFNCGLSVAKYRHRLSAMKYKNIDIGPAQKSVINRALPKI